MRIYISGPMTGIEKQNKPAFEFAENEIERLGHNAVSPHKLGEDVELIMGSTKPKYRDYMLYDLKFLLQCEAVVLLTGYEKSKGCGIEIRLARDIGLPFYKLTPDGLHRVDLDMKKLRPAIMGLPFSNKKDV